MSPQRISTLVMLVFLTAIQGAESATQHIAQLENASLQVVIADNGPFGAEHRSGYNGLAEPRLATRGAKNLFVPNYAGLNLEHVFSGDVTSFDWNIFEPRRSPMELIRHSPTRVELRQNKTEHWPLRSRLVYELKDDGVDFIYYGTPLEDLWAKHHYIGIFFASYIQAPEDMAIEFIGRGRPGRGDPQPRWLKHLPEKHGQAANHRPAGSTWDPALDDGFTIELVKGISNFEYIYPFYFGRSGENVFILMFERNAPEGELRFAQSPSGGGNGNPAWDFVYFRRDYSVNREFNFRVRAVYRKFVSKEEVASTYEKWSGEKVNLP